jgi:hypothetical protein
MEEMLDGLKRQGIATGWGLSVEEAWKLRDGVIGRLTGRIEVNG